MNGRRRPLSAGEPICGAVLLRARAVSSFESHAVNGI
jgi:hypothetical protein